MDYYKILGIEQDADSESIKKAYKRLAKLHHPDLNPDDIESSEQKFKEINEAYHVLIDVNERKKYDQFGADFEQLGGGGARFEGDAILKLSRSSVAWAAVVVTSSLISVGGNRNRDLKKGRTLNLKRTSHLRLL